MKGVKFLDIMKVIIDKLALINKKEGYNVELDEYPICFLDMDCDIDFGICDNNGEFIFSEVGAFDFDDYSLQMTFPISVKEDEDEVLTIEEFVYFTVNLQSAGTRICSYEQAWNICCILNKIIQFNDIESLLDNIDEDNKFLDLCTLTIYCPNYYCKDWLDEYRITNTKTSYVKLSSFMKDESLERKWNKILKYLGNKVQTHIEEEDYYGII